MNGLGFLVWKLSSMPPVDQLIPLLKIAGVNWISIKVADGTYPYNCTPMEITGYRMQISLWLRVTRISVYGLDGDYHPLPVTFMDV